MTLAYPGLALPGDTYPSKVTSAFFTPPTVWRTLDPTDRLFCRMRLPVGVAVLKSDSGGYVTVENPSDEQISAAAATYLGGHTYPVSQSEADALTAAGYEVTE